MESDFYPTPPEPTLALLRWTATQFSAPSLVVDPFAGDGAILRVVSREAHRVGGMELREECRPALDAVVPGGAVYCDALATGGAAAELRNALRFVPGAVGITNPPYSLAQQCVETWAPSFDWSAWLLRLAFLETDERGAWLRGPFRPSHVLVLDKRPKFVAVCKGLGKTKKREKIKGCGRSYPIGTKGRCECGGTIGDGSDASAYAWFVWPGRGARGRLQQSAVQLATSDAVGERA